MALVYRRPFAITLECHNLQDSQWYRYHCKTSECLSDMLFSQLSRNCEQPTRNCWCTKNVTMWSKKIAILIAITSLKCVLQLSNTVTQHECRLYVYQENLVWFSWHHLGPTGPRWAPCWSHGLCYLGRYETGVFVYFALNYQPQAPTEHDQIVSLDYSISTTYI